jgi:PRC-barrel domain protein
MWKDVRTSGVVALVAVLVGAAGLSAAADRGSDLRRQLAQAAGPADDSAANRPPAGEAAATFLDQQDVQGILGRQVLSSAGEDMGRVVDIVVDRNGQVRAAVIDFGGFLGVGNRKVAVDWNALHFAPTGSRYDRITLELTRDQVKAAPEYKDGRPLVVLGTAEGLPPSPPPN